MSIRKLASTIAVIGLLGLGAQTCSAFSLGGPALGFQSGNFGYGRLGLSLVRVGALTYNAQNLGEEVEVGRYHSWIIDRNNFPQDLEITAVDENNYIMALQHRKYDVQGVQFHPESVLTPEGEKMMRNWLN